MKLETGGRSNSPVTRSPRIRNFSASTPESKTSNKSSSSFVNRKVSEARNTSSPSAEDSESKDKSKKRKVLDARTYKALFSSPQMCEETNNSGTYISVEDTGVAMISTSADKIVRLDPDCLAVTNDKSASLDVLVESCPTSSSAPKVDDLDPCNDNDEFQRKSPLSSLDVDDERLPMEEDTGRAEESECRGISQEDLSPTIIKDFEVGMKTNGSIACVICKDLHAEMSCEGKDCRRSYHLSCLNPPLRTIPPGAWLCFCCLKKQIEHGVYSITEGIDSVWDFREETQNGKLYFVKYKGLAHVHNRWIPESQLLSEAPRILELYNRRHQKEVNIWNKEWIEPHRLLLRRMLLPQNVADEFFERLGDKSSKCYHVWFVKWKGLGYEDATWEMESLPCLGAPNAIKLMKDYETRVEKTDDSSKADKISKLRQDTYHKMSKFPEDYPAELDNDHLNSVNKLWEFWYKRHNALLIDKQERATKSILFIMSLVHHSYRPILIVATRDSLSFWESKFNNLAPMINLVVYSGLKDVRNMIRSLEFYNEYGCIMFQVLLSHPDAVLEDFDTLKCICWEAILVDDCENFRISEQFKQLNYLSTDFRVLLLEGQLKDSIDEYANVLFFLGYDVEGKNSATVNCNSKDSVLVLPSFKEKLASYTAYEHKENCSRFLEYWVPVHLTPVQLELYSAMLLSKSSSLCSSSTSDSADVLRDVLVSARMCCDHPSYLMDGSLESTLMKNLAASDNLNVGVNSNGKLQLLDKVLHELRTRGLRVVILFQAIAHGKSSIGDILDDFLAKRFGIDSFERVVSGLTMLKKRAAMSNFNDKEKGRFVFLIEHRACLPSIKLSSVDAVIIYNSDWNPLNDLRVLQKINIETQQVHIPVFRLYSSLTVEERILALAKQNVLLECNLANVNWTDLHSLLRWGAFDLFQQLDDFHRRDHLSGGLPSSTYKLLDSTVLELMSVLQNNDKFSNPSKFLSLVKAYQSGASYSRHIILAGDGKGVSSLDEDPPNFWSRLLNQRSPLWRYLCDPSQKSRIMIPSSDETLKSLEPEYEANVKKRRKLDSSSVEDSNSSQIGQQEEIRETAERGLNMMGGNSKEGIAIGSAHKSGAHESERKEQLSGTRKSMHMMLKPELTTLCEKLRLPVDVEAKAQEFLEYIIRNHSVGRESETTLQAFKIALCWRTASLVMHDIDREETLARAKKYLNYSCDADQAFEIYHKLKILKKIFSPAKVSANGKTECKSAESLSHISQIETPVECSPMMKSTLSLHQKEISSFETVSTEKLDVMQQESAGTLDVPVEVIPLRDEMIRKNIELVNRVCGRRLLDLLNKQEEELAELNLYKEKEELKLKDAHNKDLTISHTLHAESVASSERINLLNHNFSEKMDRFKRHFERQLHKLKDLHQISREKEKQMGICWLEAAATFGSLSLSFDDIPLSDSGFRLEEFSCVAEHSEDYDNIVQTKESLSCTQPPACQQIGSLEDSISNMIISDGIGSISSELADENPMQTKSSVPSYSYMNGEALQNQTIMDIPSTIPSQGKAGMLRGTGVAGDISSGSTNSATPENIEAEPQSLTPNCQQRNEQFNNTSGGVAPNGMVMETENIASDSMPNETVMDADLATLTADETQQHLCASNRQLSSPEGRGGEDSRNTCLISPATCNQTEHLVQVMQAEEQESSQGYCGLGDGSSTIPQDSLPLISVDTVLETHVLMQVQVEASPTELVHNTTDVSSSPQHSIVMPLVEQISERLPASAEILTPPSCHSSHQIDLTMQEAIMPSEPVIYPGQDNASEVPQRTNVEYARSNAGGLGDGSSTIPQGILPLISVDTALETNVLMQGLVETSPTELVYDTTAVSNSPQHSVVMPLVERNSERLPASAEIQASPSSHSSQQIELTMQEAIVPSEPVIDPVQHNADEVTQRTNVEDARSNAGGLGDGSSTIPQGSLPLISVDTALETNVLMQELVETSPTELVYSTTAVSNSPLHSVVMPLVEQNSERLPASAEIQASPFSHSSQQIDLTIQEAIVHPVQHDANDVPQRTNVEDGRSSADRVESFCSFQVFPLTSFPPHQFTQQEPLLNELSKIKNHENVLLKMYDDMKSKLNFECEQEIEKIKKKYESLLQDGDKEFLQSKKTLETIYNKVLKNQILAEEFKARFFDVKGQHSSSPHQSVQQLHPENQRPVSGPVSCPTTLAATQSPAIRPFSTRFRPPSSTAPSSQTAPMSGPVYPSNFMPPQFSSPARGSVGSETRAPAPHLRRFRPSGATATLHNVLPRPTVVSLQQPLSSEVVVHAGPLHNTQRIPASAVCQQVVSGIASASTVELPPDVRDYQEGRNLPSLPQSNETGPVIDGRSNLAWMPGPSQSPSGTSNRPPAVDILCLSDDE